MTTPTVQINHLEIDTPHGTWIVTRLPDGSFSIGGQPFPSEAEAHAFDTVVMVKIRKAIVAALRAQWPRAGY